MKKFKILSKKAISALLAIVVVLGSMTATLGVFANTEPMAEVAPYAISWGSPAIPMFEGKIVNLNDFTVEFAKGGTPVLGSEISWRVADANESNITVNQANKYLTALSKGKYKLIAEYAETEKNIWVIVNEAGDYDFKIVDVDFLRDGYDSTEWLEIVSVGADNYKGSTLYYTPEDKLTANVPSYNSAGYIETPTKWNVGCNVSTTIIYKDDIMLDFADYTLSAVTQFNQARSISNPYSTLDLVVRANLNTFAYGGNAFAEGNSAFLIGSRDYGGARIQSITTADYGDPIRGTYQSTQPSHIWSGEEIGNVINNIASADSGATYGTQNIEFMPFPEGSDYTVGSSSFNGYLKITSNSNVGKKFNVELVMNGNDVKYSLGRTDLGTMNVILDTADTSKKIYSNYIDQRHYAYHDLEGAGIEVIENNGSWSYSAPTTPTENTAKITEYLTEKTPYTTGYIGFSSVYNNNRIYSFSAKLNGIEDDGDLPAMGSIKQITWESPAIPAFLNKTVDFSTAYIQLEQNGAFYAAKDLTFEYADTYTGVKGIIINNDKDNFSTLVNGIYPLTATAEDGKSATVYVIVEDDGDYEFNLVNKDFTVAGSYVESEWIAANNGTGGLAIYNIGYTTLNTITTAATTAANAASHRLSWSTSGLKVGKVWHEYVTGIMYKSDVLKDFADYTVKTNLSLTQTSDGTRQNSVHIFPRATVDPNGTKMFADVSHLYLRVSPYGGLAIAQMNSTTDNGTFLGGTRNATFHSLDNSGLLKAGDTSFSADYVLAANKASNDPCGTADDGNSGKLREIEFKFSGSDIRYKLDGKTIFDSTATINRLDWESFSYQGPGKTPTFTDGTAPLAYSTYKTYVDTPASKKGTIAFAFTRGADALFKNLKVTLNDVSAETMLPATDLDIYTVEKDQPVIPMTAGYQISLAEFLITDASNSIVSAANAVFTTDAAASDFEIADGYLKAYKKGTYKLTAEDGTVLYAVVKNPDETEYTVFENDYRSNIVDNGDGTYSDRSYVDDFETTIFYEDKVFTNTALDTTGAVNFAKTNGVAGYSPYDYTALTTAIPVEAQFGKFVYFYTVLQNDAVKALKNYKATVNVVGDQLSTDALGVAGRITNVSDDYKLTTSSSIKGFGLASGYGTAYPGPLGKAVVLDNTRTLSAWAGGDALSFPYSRNRWGSHNGEKLIHGMTVEFNGTTAKYTTAGSRDAAVMEVAEEAGAFAFAFYAHRPMTTGWTDAGKMTPSILDVKIVLTGVEDGKLSATKIADPAEYTAPKGYTYVDGYFTFTVDAEGVLTAIGVDDSKTPSEVLKIPANVTAIGSGSSVLNATILASVREIDMSEATSLNKINHYAFNTANTVIEKVTFPENSLKYIGNYAFKDFKGLTEITMPDSVTSTGMAVFQNCYGLRKAKLSENLTILNYNVFVECHTLSEVIVSKNVETVYGGLFRYCRYLRIIELPEEYRLVGEFPFQTCTSIVNINIPTTGNIPPSAFDGATSLSKDVLLGIGCTSIGNYAFRGTSITKFTVLNKDAVIGTTAFPTGATIYGYTGSTADAYVTANPDLSLTFVAIDDVRNGNLPANTRFNLAASTFKLDGTDTSVSGDTLTWTTDSNLCEVSGGYLNVYAAGTATVIGTSDAGTVTLSGLTLTAAGTDTALLVEAFADSNIAISALGNNKYSFTVAENVNLIPGKLDITDNGTPVYSVDVAADKSGKVFNANVYAPHTMLVSAEYEADNNVYLSTAYMMGNQIKSEEGNLGIRFVAGIPAIRLNAVSQQANLITDQLTVDGKKVTLSAVGSLLIPNALLNGELRPLDESELTLLIANSSIDSADAEINVGGRANAKNVVIYKLSEATEEFSVANTLLDRIPASFKNTPISTVTYIQYVDEEGYIGYVYSDTLTKSYNEVEDVLYPNLNAEKLSTNLSLILNAGTDHDLDGNSATDSISYGLDEDITFSVQLKGAYKMKWALYKDNAADNLYGNETLADGSTTELKNETVNYSYVDNYFTCTTRRATAGSAVLKVTVLGPEDKAVATFRLTALADAENIKQPVETLGLSDEDVIAETTAKYDEWTTAWDSNIQTVTTAMAADTDFNAWMAKTDKKVGDTITVDNLLKLKVAAVEEQYISYHYWMATDATVGIDVAPTADNFNVRPATGAFMVPTNLTGTTNLAMSFYGYGDGKGTYKFTYNWELNNFLAANAIKINTNNNGINNDDDSTEIVEKNSYMGNQTVENADKLYQYGIIRRNYTVLNVAKALFADKYNGTVSVAGGSMGAWQAVSTAMIDEHIKSVDISIPWMANIGAVDASRVDSWHPPYDHDGNNGARIFSTTTAARIINARITESGEAYSFIINNAGLGDFEASAPSSVMAVYNAITAPSCSKSISMKQFVSHSGNFYNATVGTQNVPEYYIATRSYTAQ